MTNEPLAPRNYSAWYNPNLNTYFFLEEIPGMTHPDQSRGGYFMDYHSLGDMTLETLQKENKVPHAIITNHGNDFEVFMSKEFHNHRDIHSLIFRRKENSTDLVTIFLRRENATLSENRLRLLGFTKQFTFTKVFKA